ncbi:MAG: FixH family protein [Armatimonadota bacterium]|nr:FixH family protein [Armatimonadota bacterium]MDR7444964.1 FixH family protein [Armatimonadota bacterium]MDR7570549.1 FixH family protein [Armatimonadota bacterium]MDR7615101.1 FixH family protein [Armatimonadota bacterium]
MRGVALLCALALAACASVSAAEVSGEGWKARLEWSPASPRALRTTALRLRIEDGSGKPLGLSKLRAVASMPEMVHGPEEILFREVAPGRYEAQHVFSMDGRWEIRVTGESGGVQVLASFNLSVGP